MINLVLNEKEAAAVHALYSVGADLVFARLDPKTIGGCVGILTNFTPVEIRALRDKLDKLAEAIPKEKLAELGITVSEQQ